MLPDHHYKRLIPFWRTLLFALSVVVVMPGCANRDQRAASEATLAQELMNSKDLPAARKAISAAIADRGDVADYHILLGRIELASGSSSAAFNAYRDALALDATNTEALMQVAQLGLTTGNLAASLDATKRLMDLHPDQPDVLLLRGIHSMVRHNYSEASSYADKILAVSPDNVGGAILKARALYLSHKPKEAFAALDKITGKAAESEPVALTKLEMYRAQGQSSQMLSEFQRLRSLRPHDLGLRLDEANLRLKLGDRRAGQQLVEGVLASPEADSEIANQAISLWQEYGAEDVSSAAIDRIGRLGGSAARTSLVRFLLDEGRSSDAAHVLSGLSGDAGQGLKARLLLLNGEIVPAAKLASKTLARDKSNCDALVAAAGSALQQRMAQDALRFSQRASSECPSLLKAWLLSASAYEALGQEGGVNRVYGQALDVNDQSAPLTAAYTRWLVSQGQKRKAVAMAHRLTEYAPALLSGWRIYQDLCRRFDQSCVSDATKGLAKAHSLLGIDLAPGEPPPNGLYGRFVQQ